MTAVEEIGRFVVLNRLGVGAHAAVYRAEDPVLDQQVALKVLAAHVAFDPDGRERFIKEARLMRRITSPRTAAVHDVAQLPDGRPYLVLELAERGTLADRVDDVQRTATRLTPDDVRAVAVALGSALAAIHDRGVVHRDVKPSNILLKPAPDGQPPDGFPGGRLLRDDDYLVLSDFGLAKALESTRRITAAVGTPAYMAPEQAAVGAPIDGRADIFAASAVVAELVELAEDPVDPRVRDVLARGTARDREERHPDARAWTRDLVSAIDSSRAAVTVRRPPAPRPHLVQPAVQPAGWSGTSVPQTAGPEPRVVIVRRGVPGGPVVLALLVAAVLLVAILIVILLQEPGGAR